MTMYERDRERVKIWQCLVCTAGDRLFYFRIFLNQPIEDCLNIFFLTNSPFLLLDKICDNLLFEFGPICDCQLNRFDAMRQKLPC